MMLRIGKLLCYDELKRRVFLVNGTIFGFGGWGWGELLNLKCVVVFLYYFYLKTFLILRRIYLDMTLNVQWSSCKVPGILVRL